uniref:Cytochrome b-c1 complex subunit 8 n=1 Tax=Argas monolakensis TaxID=34602 RepID=Q09JK0_ARGMO|nr:ubiquinol cytochrome c reductase subunit QCR8 [Argas monolakensis]
MGGHFGNLYKLRGIITYRLSYNEQKALAGIISKGFPNTIRRIREQILYIAPPFVGGYLLYDWAKREHERLSRKNPEDYVNDK